MKRTLLLFGLLACAAAVWGQSDFRPAYVITHAGDTLHGEIDYRGSAAMSRVCVFRTAAGDEVHYAPADIAAYRFVDSKYYVSRRWQGKDVFLELLVRGELDVYFSKDSDGEHYYLEKAGMPLTKVPFEEEEVMVDGRQYVRAYKHCGVLNVFTQEVPGLQTDIRRMKELSPAGMIGLAQKYHHAVCDDYSCVVYEKVPPRVKVDLEAVGGAFNFMRSELTDGYTLGWSVRTGVQVGVQAHVWLPRANEKLFFRTGLVATVFDNGNKGNLVKDDGRPGRYMLKIPLAFEYRYPKGIVRPKASYGMNYYIPNLITTSGMVGVNFFVGRQVALSLAYEIETAPWLFFLPSRHLWGQQVSAGVYVKL